ncbi:RNase3 domain-containing protein [Apiospora marii]|uniref:RNase3 domain-containing protein n=1 Tax=Apiospora marii TaxID=335849 RepID=UPI00312CCD3B
MSKRQFSEFSADVGANANTNNANEAISAIIKHAEELLKAACALKQELASGKQPKNSNAGSISKISRDLLPAVTYFAGSSPAQQTVSSNKAPKLDESLRLPSPTGLTAWTPSDKSFDMPPLPLINDPVLDKAAFTHSGMISKPGDMSYERLEWVGDAYLELFATIFIYHTFPKLPAGRCSQYRESLVKNETLSKYTKAYELDKRIIFPPEFDFGSSIAGHGAKAKTHKKVLGDIFEAYIAAVILGDPESGLVRASSWMKALWGRDLAKEIKSEYNSRQNAQQAAIQAGTDNSAGLPAPTTEDVHPKTRLSKKIGTKGVRIYYLDENDSVDKKSKQRKFTVGAYVDAWGESKVQLGTGTALSKTEAGAKAAQNALENKKLMKKYEQKKQEWEEAMRAQLQYD